MKNLPNEDHGGNPDSSPQRQNVVRPAAPPPAQEAASARDHQATSNGRLDLDVFRKRAPLQTPDALHAYLDAATPKQLRQAVLSAFEGHQVYAEVSGVLMDAIEVAADLLRAGDTQRALRVLEQIEATAAASAEADHG